MILRRTAFATLTSLALASASFAASAADHVFSNTAAIDQGLNSGTTVGTPSNPYPSSIAVSGLSGNITNVSITLNGLSHSWPGDLQVIVVAPGGQKIALMQRIGSILPTPSLGCSQDLAGAVMTFDAGGGTGLSNCSYAPAGGIFTPTIGQNLDDSPSPAPTGPYSADLTTLNGSSAAQTGDWNLYISDHSGGDSVSISGGWTIDISTANPTTTTCASEGYRGAQLTWCKNICENGLTGQVLDSWIHRWINRYRQLPYCGAGGDEGGEGGEGGLG